MKISWKKLILSILVPLLVGGLAAWFTRDSMDLYPTLNKPPLAPPMLLFHIIWSILYILMGISYYIMQSTPDAQTKQATTIYGLQLLVNFLWPIIFFNMQAYLFAAIWLLILIFLIILMLRSFHHVHPSAAYLQIPYLLWTLFAAYLNIAIYLLNRS